MAEMRFGFACAWDDPPELTWSYVPSRLLDAMQARADVIDIGPHLLLPVRTTLRAMHVRRHNGRWRSDWRRSRLTTAIYGAMMAPPAHRVDAILQIHDLATFTTPYYVYQDLSYDLLLQLWDHAAPTAQFSRLTRSDVQRRAARQRAIYERAEGIFAMSAWFAQSLRDRSDIGSTDVHVMHPGANAGPNPRQARVVQDRPVETTDLKLLFVGRDFFRKGGDLVVEAFTRLRRTWRPDLHLTVIGPPEWPMSSTVPDGVRFLGGQSVETTRHAFRTHDLFVMPSRFEAFGISFVEALAWGCPAIGRNAFAMPELINRGHNGQLIDRDDDLDQSVVDVVEDLDLRRRVREEAPKVARHFSWPVAAETALQVMNAQAQ